MPRGRNPPRSGKKAPRKPKAQKRFPTVKARNQVRRLCSNHELPVSTLERFRVGEFPIAAFPLPLKREILDSFFRIQKERERYPRISLYHLRKLVRIFRLTGDTRKDIHALAAECRERGIEIAFPSHSDLG